MSGRNFLIYSLTVVLVSCSSPKQQPLFELMKSEQTGLQFTNKLTATPAFNMFNYMYFYNGAGVGAGDFNNDGLIDLFFASNQAQNKLFINKGSLQFTDVTKEAAIPNDGGWSTGVSVVDINNDGLLDIYVCRVGQYEVLKGKNQLLICKEIRNGIPVYEDQATAYGLDFSGFSTQAVFFDYDLDGDLDIYLMNHSVHHNGTFAARANFLNTYHPLSGDRFYKNENGKCIDATKETGINSSAIGYGLGICVSDINKDGWPDLYIGNDFHENDYLYINQQNGTFKEELNERMMHTSQFSMGVDIADINNDALPEIISM
ncbi:MAG TPA: VCBS repeat-containing protein, partial [Lacibacter sp.]|nr:VCBS repeat-containing protein [Lacibacter sp.]